ncbi:MAG: nucleoside transporter C-terminal domain-containing protein [Planctomycetota bacterium]
MLRLVSLCGLFVILLICFLVSSDRRAIRWRTVAIGLGVQLVLGLLFLYWDRGNTGLRAFGQGVSDFLGLAMRGTGFVWGVFAEGAEMRRVFGENKGFVFAVMVLPTLIFFSSFMAVLYHLGVMQAVVRAMSSFMVRFMGTSGSESLSACANVFVGQTEAPLLVKPYLPRMTRSELHAIMVGGFATIAGGVFVLYTGFGADPGHLMVASVMAAPAGLVCSKLALPETEPSETMGRVVHSVDRTSSNVVEAAANGAIDGLHLALNVGAMLIAFLGLVAVIDWLLAGLTGGFFGAPQEEALSLGKILAWAFSPLAALMGASFDGEEILTLGELLGTKLALTELVAYARLGELKTSLSPRTVMLASFALCGFANFASVAIQIGGLGAMAPDRRRDLAALGLRAMLIGSLATCMTACLAGVLTRV